VGEGPVLKTLASALFFLERGGDQSFQAPIDISSVASELSFPTP
jgi:hypothetical protein